MPENPRGMTESQSWMDLRNHWCNYFPIHDSLAQYPPQVVVYPSKIITTDVSQFTLSSRKSKQREHFLFCFMRSELPEY